MTTTTPYPGFIRRVRDAYARTGLEPCLFDWIRRLPNGRPWAACGLAVPFLDEGMELPPYGTDEAEACLKAAAEKRYGAEWVEGFCNGFDDGMFGEHWSTAGKAGWRVGQAVAAAVLGGGE